MVSRDNNAGEKVTIVQYDLNKKRRQYHWRPRLIIERCENGHSYIASHPGHPMFKGWYLRRVQRVAGRLYRETGDVWCVEDDPVGSATRSDIIFAIQSLWRYRKGEALSVPILQSAVEYVGCLARWLRGRASVGPMRS